MDRREQEPKATLLERATARVEQASEMIGYYAGSVVEFANNLDLRRNALIPVLAVIAVGGALEAEADAVSAQDQGSQKAKISRYTDVNSRTNSVTTTTFKNSKNQTSISVKTSSRKPKSAQTSFDALKSTNPADPLAPKELRYRATTNDPIDLTIRVPFNFEFGKETPATFIFKYDAKQKWKPRGIKVKNAKTFRQTFGRTPWKVYDLVTAEGYGLTNFKDNLYYQSVTGKSPTDTNKHKSLSVKPNRRLTAVIPTTFEQCNAWDFRPETAEKDMENFKGLGFDPVPPKDRVCLPAAMSINFEGKIKKTKKRGGKKLVYEASSGNTIGVENVNVINPTPGEIFRLPVEQSEPTPTGATGPTE